MLALGVFASNSAMAQSAPGVSCAADLDCNDGNIFTMNWCDNSQCQTVRRRGDECTESEWAWCFWDFQCDDGDANTEDWCHFGTCKNHARTARPGNCDAPKGCTEDIDCQNGDPSTASWCHENTCRVVHREDPICTKWGDDCNTDQDCASITNARPDLVSWCYENSCYATWRTAVDECQSTNTIPEI